MPGADIMPLASSNALQLKMSSTDYTPDVKVFVYLTRTALIDSGVSVVISVHSKAR